MSTSFATLFVSCALAVTATSVRAAPCDLAATLDGDPSLLDPVAASLRERGVTVNQDDCVGIHARIEADGAQLVVRIDRYGETVTRFVSNAASAATVIESWTRTDVASPLLEISVPSPEAPTPAPAEERIVVMVPRGIHVFAAGETSIASDGTLWAGAQLGACIKLGPVCAAARARFASVVTGFDPFDGAIDRRRIDVLLGADIPLAYRGVMFSPGIAAGVGSIQTHLEDEEGLHMGRETGGLRADAHITVTIPVRRKLAFDLFGGIDITQQTEIEHASTMKLPDDPLALLTLGAGLRYEGL